MRSLIILASALAALVGPSAWAQTQVELARLHIKHVVVIMQENRTFDQYFGTFPGADGIPAGTCVPNVPGKKSFGCTRPFHNPNLVNAGGPHTALDSLADVDGGKMDGFIFQQMSSASGCLDPTKPTCRPTNPGVQIKDVMGYHDGTDIPNYWAYAKDFVLQDHMFEAVGNWSWPSHLAMVSDWVATCGSLSPLSCRTVETADSGAKNLAWTYLPWLLDRNNVSWKYYLGSGNEPDCSNGQMTCDPQVQNAEVPGKWNPIPAFELFTQAVQANAAYKAHVTPFDTFLVDVKNGTLPAVSWIVPGDTVSEHPPSDVGAGENYVTTIVNAIAQSSSAADTVIFLSWDDWGGFYDHVPPPVSLAVSLRNPDFGWGIRVPGLMISAWAKAGFIDHQYLSFDNYNRFIEDVFTNSARLDPATDGRPDNRPTVFENTSTVHDLVTNAAIPVGDLLNDFDFTSAPRTIPVLPVAQRAAATRR